MNIPVNAIEVKLLKPYAVIRETLDRIGIANRKEKKIFPSCYILESEGKSYMFHFKELLKNPMMEDIDTQRKNTILWLLEKWSLIKIENEAHKNEVYSNMLQKKIFILSKTQQTDEGWKIVPKYHGLQTEKSTN